ncbi:unnamed protein product [Lota lota]
MDLSTGFSVNSLTRNPNEAMDLVKKPEWYRRHTATCSADSSSPLRTRHRTDGGKPEVGLVVPTRPATEEAARRDDPTDCRNASLPPQGLGLFHDSVHGRLWQAGFYRQPSLTEGPAVAVDSSTGTDSDSGSDVLFLLSASKDPAACSSASRESPSPAGEPQPCFLLPSALSWPSCESSSSSDSSDGSSVIPVRHARPVVLLSDVKVEYRKYSESPIDISSDDDGDGGESTVAGVAVSGDELRHRVYADSGSDKASVSEEKAIVRSERGDLRRSPRIKMAAVPAAAEFACRVSQRNLRSQVKCGYEEVDDPEDVMDYIKGIATSSSSSSSSSSSEEEEQEEIPFRPKLQRRTRNTSGSSDDSSGNWSGKSSGNATGSDGRPSGWRPSEPARGGTRWRAEQIPEHTEPVGRNTRLKPATPLPAPKPAPAATRKAAPRKKVAGKRRRQRKRRQPGSPPPLFPPGEPDVLLKYTRLREQRKKKSRAQDFQPFVHVGKRTCTVVNHQEDEGSAASPASPPGCLPGTTCYRLGRLGSRSRGRPPQSCCLCGRSANAMGLGDLHGPYYPVHQLTRGEGLGDLHGPYYPVHQLTRGEGLGDLHGPYYPSDRVHGDGDEEEEEEDGGGAVEDDRSSVKATDSSRVVAQSTPPAEEWWVHEDCGVWSTGVFLVRGHLYGLKEASKVTRDVVCCGCHESGAIMGCLQKGCMLNYHYRCAISSGCLLNEENFSMKCSKHKNKVFTRAAHHPHKR